MTEIECVRFQHPVGQGGFHSATIWVDSAPILDYVYDCGAAIPGNGKTLPKALKYAIRSYAPVSAGLHALFMSHFDQDHVLGVLSLVQQLGRKVKRIFVPYIDPQMAWALLIRNQAMKEDSLAQEYMEAVQAVAGGGGLTGIPTIRIVPEGDQPESDQLDRHIRRLDDDSLQHDGDVSHGVEFGLGDTHSIQTAWRIRSWVYLYNDLKNAIREAVEKEFGSDLPDGWRTGVPDPQYLAGWLDANRRKRIKTAYKSALRATGVVGADDHNLVSMCLYSGPVLQNTNIAYMRFSERLGCCPLTHLDEFIQYPRNREYLTEAGGWIGTGDAPLKLPRVWASFDRHFRVSLPRAETVVLPHHGSRHNFHLGLIQHARRAVISHGSRNAYGHPHCEVAAELLRAGVPLQRVSELSPAALGELIHLAI